MSTAFEQRTLFALGEIDQETEAKLDKADGKNEYILKTVPLSTEKAHQGNKKWEKRFTKVKAAIISVFLPSQKSANRETGKNYVQNQCDKKLELPEIESSPMESECDQSICANMQERRNSLFIPRPHNFPARKLLPEQKGKNLPTLVLDLDETLTHSNLEDTFSDVEADLKFKVHWNWENLEVKARFRPHLKLFLEKMSEKFEIVIFTASLAQFASPVMDAIDPDGRFISHRLYRESCTYFGGFFIKDLSSLNRNLKSTVIVDNSPNSYMWHVENAISIKSWYSESTDRELIRVMHLLNKRVF
jgi:CTD small phosphatase-like protein 2